jgi:hypothetical protein
MKIAVINHPWPREDVGGRSVSRQRAILGTKTAGQLSRGASRQRNDRRRNAVIAEEKGIRRGLVPRELPMSEVMSSPLPPSKTLEEQAAEILALIEEIISTAPEMEEQEEIPA